MSAVWLLAADVAAGLVLTVWLVLIARSLDDRPRYKRGA